MRGTVHARVNVTLEAASLFREGSRGGMRSGSPPTGLVPKAIRQAMIVTAHGPSVEHNAKTAHQHHALQILKTVRAHTATVRTMRAKKIKMIVAIVKAHLGGRAEAEIHLRAILLLLSGAPSNSTTSPSSWALCLFLRQITSA